jgi:hypothetical protein
VEPKPSGERPPIDPPKPPAALSQLGDDDGLRPWPFDETDLALLRGSSVELEGVLESVVDPAKSKENLLERLRARRAHLVKQASLERLVSRPSRSDPALVKSEDDPVHLIERAIHLVDRLIAKVESQDWSTPGPPPSD